MQRHMEDLENRGRRSNVRIRGIPESLKGPQLQSVVWAIFNTLLGRPLDTPVDMERCHKALRSRGRDTDPLRDTVCCLVHFTQKEEILRSARHHGNLEHEGVRIQLFRDLSAITLQHRRDLRPILNVLRDRHISYRWKFSFCLQATVGNCTALLKVPANIQSFCETLGNPVIELPDWYSTFLQHEPWIPTQLEDRRRADRDADGPRPNGDIDTDESPRVSPLSARHKTDHRI